VYDFSIACRVNLNSIPNWVRIFDFGGDTNVFMMLTPASGTGPGSDLQVLDITFDAIAEGTSALGLYIDQLIDGSAGTIGTTWGIGRSVEVTTGLPGNADGDGDVDIVDALLVAQYYVELIDESC
jgi:hypothetical protein